MVKQAFRPMIFICGLLACVMSPQASAIEPYQLLFARLPDALSITDMRSIAAALDYSITEDGKGLQDSSGCGSVQWEVHAVDLNQDGIAEVVVIAGNLCTSGATGSSAFLFIKNRGSTRYSRHLGIPALDLEVLPRRRYGFPDLRLGGRGFCRPIWQWRGGAYEFACGEEQEAGACAAVAVKRCDER